MRLLIALLVAAGLLMPAQAGIGPAATRTDSAPQAQFAMRPSACQVGTGFACSFPRVLRARASTLPA
ncbi:MAG TPA: hypothetical protein VFO79_09325 [Xanthomonadales bacterium]|nr:hypothetical protein [Xanthomonadales bacterium]